MNKFEIGSFATQDTLVKVFLSGSHISAWLLCLPDSCPMVKQRQNEVKLQISSFQVATVQRPSKPRHTDRLLPRPGRPLLGGGHPVGNEVHEVWMWNSLSL